MLKEGEILKFLINEGYICADRAFSEGIRIVANPCRHSNHAVILNDGSGFFIKQGDGKRGFGTIRHEALVLANLADGLLSTKLQNATAQFLGYHEHDDVLILALVVSGENLRYRLQKRPIFSRILAQRLGQLLGTLHESDDCIHLPQNIVHNPPWVLSLHKPKISLMREVSAGNLILITMLQDCPELVEGFDDLRMAWMPTVMIHFDVKLDNILVAKAEGTLANRTKTVTLVDWEFAGLGSPGWDVGSVFAEILALWAQGFQIANQRAVRSRIDYELQTLKQLKPAVHSFWNAYCIARNIQGTNEVTELLHQCMRWTAARLIQSAYEITQTATRPRQHVGLMMQLAVNLLSRPKDAASQLLNL